VMHTHDRRRGLTLLEVLIALALIAALFGALFVFYHQLLSSRDVAINAAARDAGIDQFFESMEAALQTCVAEGFSGEAQRLSVVCRSVALFAGGEARLRDREQRAYRFDPQSRTLALSRAVEGSPAITGDLLADVGWVRFRYHDGEAWGDSFRGSGEAALPLLVEIAVWFDVPRDPGDALDEEGAFAVDPELEAWADDLFGAVDPEDAREFADTPGDEDPAGRPDRLRVILIPDARARQEREL